MDFHFSKIIYMCKIWIQDELSFSVLSYLHSLFITVIKRVSVHDGYYAND